MNPYLGGDSVEPFLRHEGKGVILLCRTSNPGGDDVQYTHIARRIAEDWSRMGECGLVVGATYPAEVGVVRSIVGDLRLLVPGIGAQGGDVEATVRLGLTVSPISTGARGAPILFLIPRAA